ncbi:c-type cytochrome [Mucilaginibacter humi]|uniref:c-type cytochrome n=1 Tax=Mucilaginibacter humi TaxID=2732510 RepID=UPI001FEA0631|nr:c-type cytochrome [Mucilaginibacter humi]
MTLLFACGQSNGGSEAESTSTAPAAAATTADIDPEAKSDSKGIGKFKEIKLEPIDAAMAAKGEAVFSAKCSACHKMTDQKVVGPGLLGVTKGVHRNGS